MVRRKEPAPEYVLIFETVPSETTKKVKVVIPGPQTWHIYNSPEGVKLVDRTKERGRRDTYLLSTASSDISEDTPFKIRYSNGQFVVEHTRGYFEHAVASKGPYVPLISTQFLTRGESMDGKTTHRFRDSGKNLEFTLTIKQVNVQGSLFN